MTEAEWQACADPQPMLLHLRDRAPGWVGPLLAWLRPRPPRLSDRKLRLFACACYRRQPRLLEDPLRRKALDVCERYLDGRADDQELKAVREETIRPEVGGTLLIAQVVPFLRPLAPRPDPLTLADPWEAAATAADAAARFTAPLLPQNFVATLLNLPIQGTASGQAPPLPLPPGCQDERRAQAALHRDVAGNPFRPAGVDPAWLVWNDGTVPRLARAIGDGDRFD